jgi:hypothetical protein
MLCYATAYISACASRMCLLYSMILIFIDYRFVQYKPGQIHMGWLYTSGILYPTHPRQVEGSCRFSLVV